MPPFQQEFCLEAVKIGYQPIKVVGSHLSQPTVLTVSLTLINSILKYSVWKFFSNPLTDHDAQN